jgi:polyphosphate kinase 2 (PPK2 family)
VLFEGFDASGKGGAIRRVDDALDPRHVKVVPVGPPTPEELAHHFLWRFQPAIPGRGEMTIFDRSWYGRLLVERVDGLIDRDTVERSTEEIVSFERMLVRDQVTIVKFWMHVSDEEQLRRFEARKADPLKSWKLTDADWHNRSLRDEYVVAASEALKATDQHGARWHVVPANHKHFARISVLETLNAEIEKGLRDAGIEPPPSHGDDYLN